MLKSVEILIGLSVIMLVLSMVVTVLTQFVTSLLNSRGRHLKNALADLLTQIEPKLQPKAEEIARQILTHPVIRETSVLGLKRMGSVVQREEFTKILMELAAGVGPQQGGAFQNDLAAVLAGHGITNPKQTLEDARMLALKLEASNPQLANNVRQNIALLQEAASPLTAKINAWFDQMMDRTSDRFTFTTRGITFACAAILAFVLQVDTVRLVNRLSADDQLRASLGNLSERVIQAEDSNRAIRELAKDPKFAALSDKDKLDRVRSADKSLAAVPDGEIRRRITRAFVADPSFASAAPDDQRKRLQSFRPELASATQSELEREIAEASRLELSDRDQEFLTFLNERGLITLPKWSSFQDLFPRWESVPGIVVTMFLLSLGAPFWYNILKQAINLRSVLAGKEDRQREERQTKQESSPAQQPGATLTAAAAAGASGSGSMLAAGERGDLGALG